VRCRQLDLGGHQIISPEGREVALTTGEFNLLSALVHHPNRVLSRDELLELTHHREAGPFDRSIDVQIGRLRRKIEVDPEHPALIKSVRAAGYIFAAPVER
jgi:DNA-binding response OmpR family regulator